MPLTISADDTLPPPRPVTVTIACDGWEAIGALGLACDPPVVGHCPIEVRQAAVARGWVERNHDRLGRAWLCPACR